MEGQDHLPLVFLSGEFKGAQQRWTVSEKESFDTVDATTRVDDLLLSHDEFPILSGHLNLTYIKILSLQTLLSRTMLYTSYSAGH
jgi:RNase H-like domain found in reverse transcriptase